VLRRGPTRGIIQGSPLRELEDAVRRGEGMVVRGSRHPRHGGQARSRWWRLGRALWRLECTYPQVKGRECGVVLKLQAPVAECTRWVDEEVGRGGAVAFSDVNRKTRVPAIS
jgi:hypothetical protein